MKFIDEKGRLFEKLNIIDLLIVFVIIAALAGINYKFGFIKKVVPQDSTQQKALVKIWIKDISNYTTDAITIGDTVREVKSNAEFGKIVNKEVEPYREKASDLNGEWHMSEMPGRNSVYITVEVPVPTDTKDFKLGGVYAKSGASIDIRGTTFQVQAYVVEVK